MTEVPYTMIAIEDSPGKFTFTCANPECRLPHLIIGSHPYVEEKAIAHTQWCVIEKRQPPMSWR